MAFLIHAALNFTVTVSSSNSVISSGLSHSLSCVINQDVLPEDAIITYQWLKNNTQLQTETSDYYNFPSINPSDAGEYACNVTVSSTYLVVDVHKLSQRLQLRVQC